MVILSLVLLYFQRISEFFLMKIIAQIALKSDKCIVKDQFEMF